MAVQSGISGVVSLKRENGGNVARYGLSMHCEIEKKSMNAQCLLIVSWMGVYLSVGRHSKICDQPNCVGKLF